MIETSLARMARLQRAGFCEELTPMPDGNFVATRPFHASLDSGDGIACALTAIGKAMRALPAVSLVYGSAAKTLVDLGNAQPNLEFCSLVKNARTVIIGSSGSSEEITVKGGPWLRVRYSTERAETDRQGANELGGNDFASLRPAPEWLFADEWARDGIPELDGRTCKRFVAQLESVLCA